MKHDFDVDGWTRNNPEAIMNAIKHKDLNKSKEMKLIDNYWDRAQD
jgi:hypothetical protein